MAYTILCLGYQECEIADEHELENTETKLNANIFF